MRRRPDVKVYLTPPAVFPGQTLVAETVLGSRSETPIDFVEMRLRGLLRSAVGAGNARQYHEALVYDRVWRSPAQTLGEGEHRFRVEYPFAPDAPPSYAGADAAIAYELRVHVSIPWWPDRRRSFVVPVATPPTMPGADPRPIVTSSSSEGPRRGEPYMEVALDATDLALGEVLTGSVSMQNLSGKSVRGLDLAFVEMESVTLPSPAIREKGRFGLRIFDGAPPEGEAIPFRVRVPDGATPSFIAGPIRLATHVEIRADVAWGSDVVVRIPVAMAPMQRPEGRAAGPVAPVGRERILLAWQRIARSVGFVADPEGDGIDGMRGGVHVRIRSEPRGGDFWFVAELAMPSLGLDLDVGERRWSDALAVDVVKTGFANVDDKLAVHAREHVQAKPLVDAWVPTLLPFEEVKATDDRALLATRGSVHATAQIGGFVRSVLVAADALDRARSLVGPPAVLAPHVAAWQGLADALRGRLELGRMWIHDARVGTDAVAIGCTWGRRGVLLGTTVKVTVDPPLANVPPAADDPSVSPAARDAWKALAARARTVHVEADAIAVEVEAKPADPESVMPVVDLAVSLRRALSGAVAAGPFR